MKIFIVYTVLVALFLVSCHSFEGDQEIPSYVRIVDGSLANNPDIDEGELDIGIDDVSVYLENELLGTFELPVNVPVLETGKNTIKVKGGVVLNGISSMRASYPFFETFEQEVDLHIDSVLMLTPVFRYYSSTIFPWKENFENGNSSLIGTSPNGAAMQFVANSENDTIYGAISGVVYLDEQHPQADLMTNYQQGIGYTVPQNNIPVFIELSYHTNNEFGIGIVVNSNGVQTERPIVAIRPKGDIWNRIYVNLTPVLQEFSNIDYINILFHATLDEGIDDAKIFLDNMKLVTKEID
jgi:hypothetical protein